MPNAFWWVIQTHKETIAAIWQQEAFRCAQRYKPLLMLSITNSGRGSKKTKSLSYCLTTSFSCAVKLALAYTDLKSVYGTCETILPAAPGYMPCFLVYTRTLALFTSTVFCPPR